MHSLVIKVVNLDDSHLPIGKWTMFRLHLQFKLLNTINYFIVQHYNNHARCIPNCDCALLSPSLKHYDN